MTYKEFKSITIPWTRVYRMNSDHIISFIVRDVCDTDPESGIVQACLDSHELWFFANTCFLSKEECIADMVKRLHDKQDKEVLQKGFEIKYYD